MAMGRILKAAALATLFAGGAMAASAPTPRLHPVRAFTIVYRLDGQMTGTETEHSDSYGYRRAVLSRTELRAGRQVVKANTRSYTIGDTTVTIDYAAGTASRIRNPMYDRIAARMATQRAEDFAISMIRAMGYQPTGARKTIAGESCAVWKGPTGETCFTSDALSLEVKQALGAVSITRTAISVRRGDPGPASVYQPDARYPITDAGDIAARLRAARKRP